MLLVFLASFADSIIMSGRMTEGFLLVALKTVFRNSTTPRFTFFITHFHTHTHTHTHTHKFNLCVWNWRLLVGQKKTFFCFVFFYKCFKISLNWTLSYVLVSVYIYCGWAKRWETYPNDQAQAVQPRGSWPCQTAFAPLCLCLDCSLSTPRTTGPIRSESTESRAILLWLRGARGKI